jgi:hypothetical protein
MEMEKYEVRVVLRHYNSVVLVRKRTIPTERPQPAGDIIGNKIIKPQQQQKKI